MQSRRTTCYFYYRATSKNRAWKHPLKRRASTPDVTAFRVLPGVLAIPLRYPIFVIPTKSTILSESGPLVILKFLCVDAIFIHLLTPLPFRL